ncbi:MAG: hypothetical protein NWF06_03260 [Candidatus Bathyarchaeota archaeon]|nr:hypothetical protein [Candidatus Bathyarchaeum sp.]
MLPVNELKKKIEKLQTERKQLNNEIKKLKQEANGRAIKLEKEIGSLKQETQSLRELISAI